MAKPEIVQVLS